MTRALRVVCAPDKFKGSLTALQAARAIRDGIMSAVAVAEAGEPAGIARTAESAEAAHVEVAPIADGGDGTVDAAVSTGMTSLAIEVAGPTGEPVSSRIALRGERAVVELANTCGMGLLPDHVLRPLDASTIGLGQAISRALDAGCAEVVIGVGGSASLDVGLGALVGLGARLLDAAGHELPPTPRFHAEVAAVDLSGLHPRAASARFRVASDVDNPLLGPRGAVSVFGAQKGVTADLAPGIEHGIAHVARVLEQATGRSVVSLPGMGAAGGTPAALFAALGAHTMAGAEFVLDLLDLRRKLEGADLVVTGEGSFDEQTLGGKGPAAVLAEASRQGVPAAVAAGRISLSATQMRALGAARWWSLLERAESLEDAMANADALLRDIGAEIGRWLLAQDAPANNAF